MKKLVFGIIILSVLVIAVGANLIYQRYILDEMLSLLSSMEEVPSKKSFDTANRLEDIWDRHSRLFTLTAHTREIDNVSIALSKLSALSLDSEVYQYSVALGEAEIYLTAVKDGDALSLFGIL